MPVLRTFQSTHPLRGATQLQDDVKQYMTISIHAPLAGCDTRRGIIPSPHFLFQSTHPLRGATAREIDFVTRFSNFNPRTPCGVRPVTHEILYIVKAISIHAPLAGCDPEKECLQRLKPNFNPRTPCGVRLYGVPSGSCALSFQSTHPLRGATDGGEDALTPEAFQSTHPLRGATCRRFWAVWIRPFQSTHPLRGATAKTYKENCTFLN